MLQLTEFSRAQLADLVYHRSAHEAYHLQRQWLKEQLLRLGADAYNLHLPETHALPLIVHADEYIQGIVYGRYTHKAIGVNDTSRGALLITDKRLLLLNKKPFFISCQEIPFDILSGVTYNRVGPMGHVILHTRAGDFDVRTYNQRCARYFTEAVEAKLYGQERGRYDKTSY